MSTDSFSAPLPPNAAATPAGVGLGYGIAIAVGILVLVSTIMLASYLCVRVKAASSAAAPGRRRPPPSSTAAAATPDASPIPTGLDDSTIQSFPKFLYSAAAEGGGGGPCGPCPICLAEYGEGEAVRRVPECEHCFHAACVDEWLRVSPTCPLCRGSPVPSAAATPVATPLSELIPLAVHAR